MFVVSVEPYHDNSQIVGVTETRAEAEAWKLAFEAEIPKYLGLEVDITEVPAALPAPASFRPAWATETDDEYQHRRAAEQEEITRSGRGVSTGSVLRIAQVEWPR